MQTANTLPLSVGTAPGTTTFTLSGPTTTKAEVIGCENPSRVAVQKYMLAPAGKVGPGVILTNPPAPPTPSKGTVSNAVQRMRRVLDPYGTLESLKGVFQGRRRRNLGLVLAPEGDRGNAGPSYEIVSVNKDNVFCTRRPERGSNFRQDQTLAYEGESHLGRPSGFTCLGSGVPTDLQLATQYGWTPVSGQWVPFKEGAYSPLSWTPPYGGVDRQPQNQGYMTQLAGPQAVYLGADSITDVLPTPATATTPTVEEDPNRDPVVRLLREQEERRYQLALWGTVAGMASAGVVVLRFIVERHDARKKRKKSDSSAVVMPSAAVSGVRRARRRRR